MRYLLPLTFLLTIACGGTTDVQQPPPKPDCATDEDCPGEGVCHADLQVCVACRTSSDCPGRKAPYCQTFADAPEQNHCAGCLTQSHCPDGQICHRGQCHR